MNQSSLRTYVKAWIDGVVGVPHTFTLNFSADFVSGNVISGTLNALAFTSVSYATSHAATLQQLAFSIQLLSHVRTARITGSRQITVVGYVTNTTITALLSVTGGATQASTTQTTVTSASSVPVLIMDQKFESYTEQCTFKILTTLPYGIDGYRIPDADTNLALLVGSRIATLTVSYIGEDAIEKASRIYAELYSERAKTYFNERFLSVVNREPVKNLTALLDTEYAERADFDFRLSYFDEQEEDLGSIESITVDATISEVNVNQIIVG